MFVPYIVITLCYIYIYIYLCTGFYKTSLLMSKADPNKNLKYWGMVKIIVFRPIFPKFCPAGSHVLFISFENLWKLKYL